MSKQRSHRQLPLFAIPPIAGSAQTVGQNKASGTDTYTLSVNAQLVGACNHLLEFHTVERCLDRCEGGTVLLGKGFLDLSDGQSPFSQRISIIRSSRLLNFGAAIIRSLRT